MIRRLFWSLFVVVLACSAGGAAEIRRVVTGIDQDNQAVVLFDSILTLKPGGLRAADGHDIGPPARLCALVTRTKGAERPGAMVG